MKAKLIAACVVLVLMIAMCLSAYTVVKTDTERLRTMSDEAVSAFKAGDEARAMALVIEMREALDGMRPALEFITAHAAINQVSLFLTEAHAWLLSDEPKEQFVGSMALVNESLEVLYELQRLSWSNLF